MDITTILWMFMIGAAIAIITVYYNNRFLGRFVRALIEIDATSPETAITADELGIKITPAINNALKSGKSFAETVLKTKDDKYYINPERLSLAKSKYRNKEASVAFVIMSLLILLVATIALTYILPDIVDNFSFQANDMFGGGL